MSYYKEAIIKHIVTHVGEGKEEYQKFFNDALKKFDIKSPAELKGDNKKKEFFNYIEKNYKGGDTKESKVEKLRDIIRGIAKEEIQRRAKK
jgi:hypothetical protein